MGTAMPFLYSIGILFSVVGIIASYILHRKVRKLSTLVILIGYLLSVIPSATFLLANALNAPKEFLEATTFITFLSGPLIISGFLVYAIKLKKIEI